MKKCILKFVIIFIMIAIAGGVVFVFTNHTFIEKENKKEMEVQKQENVINENIIENNPIQENEDDFIKNDIPPEETEIKEENNNIIKQEQNEKIQVNNTNANTNNIDNNIKPTTTTVTEDVKQKENIEQNLHQEQKNETQQKAEENTEQKVEENTQIITPKEEIVEEVGEKYVVNNEMINKMKSIIESNPSEDMKTYGYDIVVDSSIPELTNQFTFTEQRVKDKIVWKFGTIRIYAVDYYNAGQYICTQCFII